MKLKQTLFFTIFVIGVVGYTIYDYSQIKYEDKSKTEQVKLFPHKNYEDLKEFKVTNGEKLIFIKKVGVVWQLIGPITYPGDQDFINNTLSSLNLPIEAVNELEDESIFAEATVNIGFKFEDGEYKDILVSNKKTSDGRIYIQDIKTKKQFVTNADWLGVSSKSIYNFRWKYLFILKENIKTVRFTKNGTEDYSFNYIDDNKTWQSPKIKKLVLPDKKIAHFLSDLMAIKVFKFISEIKNKEILVNFGLFSPALKIGFDFKNESAPSWGLHISKEVKGKYYATFINRNQIFELRKSDVNKLKTYLNELY